MTGYWSLDIYEFKERGNVKDELISNNIAMFRIPISCKNIEIEPIILKEYLDNEGSRFYLVLTFVKEENEDKCILYKRKVTIRAKL